MTGVAADAVAERLGGDRPSRGKALLTAGVAGIGAAMLTYKLLRSNPTERAETA